MLESGIQPPERVEYGNQSGHLSAVQTYLGNHTVTPDMSEMSVERLEQTFGEYPDYPVDSHQLASFFQIGERPA
jgi:hypothetical protein